MRSFDVFTCSAPTGHLLFPPAGATEDFREGYAYFEEEDNQVHAPVMPIPWRRHG